MLATEMKEKLESRIEIPDVNVEAAREFVKFLYTGEVSITRHLKDLLSLAALYQIEDLKEACERMLVTQLDKENAAQLRRAQDEIVHSDRSKVSNLLKFIGEHVR